MMTRVVQRYDGAGNTFFVLDDRSETPLTREEYAELAERISRPHAVDGLLLLLPPLDPTHDALLRIYNADGSEAEMCGNGARCVVRHLLNGQASDRVRLETAAGEVTGIAVDRGSAAADGAWTIALDLGPPRFTGDAIDFRPQPGDPPSSSAEREIVDFPLRVNAETINVNAVSMGNPHIVVFVGSGKLAAIDLPTLGPAISQDPHFGKGANVHFVALRDRSTLRVRHWERGAGATLACGTGAAAVAIVAIRRGLVTSPVTLLVPGGELKVAWKPGESAILHGPALAQATFSLEALLPKPRDDDEELIDDATISPSVYD